MKLTAVEETLVEMLRGNVHVDFTMTVTWLGPTWTLSITSESDGHLTGSGDTFEQAARSAFGAGVAPSPDSAAKPASRPSLRLVSGAGEVRPQNSALHEGAGSSAGGAHHRQWTPGSDARESPHPAAPGKGCGGVPSNLRTP